LDNPAWYALVGAHRDLAEKKRQAVRYPDDIAPFAALPDDPTTADWASLRALVGPKGYPALFRQSVEVPDDWEVVMRYDTLQMAAPRLLDRHDGSPIVELNVDDVPEMLRLVEQTQPGPFRSRTVELGSYLGIREHGRLVAMAGERFRFDGVTELSAVCTAPDVRGRGLARALIAELVERTRERGDEAVLHVLEENSRAIRVYELMGFGTTRKMDVVVLHPC
jgi:ribosomal protein S18 acetylase RimI-like enzyme